VPGTTHRPHHPLTALRAGAFAIGALLLLVGVGVLLGAPLLIPPLAASAALVHGAPRLPISQPAVSQHLKVLLGANLVSVRASGTRRLYALNQAGLDDARAWLERLGDPTAPFTQPLDALATEIARGRRARRTAPGEHRTARTAQTAQTARSPREQDSRPA